MTGNTEITGTRLTTAGVIGKGAEATVYAVKGHPEWALKVFERGFNQAKSQLLIAHAHPTPGAVLPIDIWHASGASNLHGLLLPRVANAHPLHMLYNPSLRRQHLPHAKPTAVLRAGRELARTVAGLHDQGIIVGDLNPNNALVNDRGTVHLIDLDSAQITIGPHRHPCHLGQPLYTAPEWQGRSLRDSRRTPADDYFALAILLYHLLMLGRHPFAGVWTEAGEAPRVEHAIAQRWYVHAKKRNLPLLPPPEALAPEVWGREVASAFQDSFCVQDPSRRPDARTWEQVLRRLEQRPIPNALDQSGDPASIAQELGEFPPLPDRLNAPLELPEIPPRFETVEPCPRRDDGPLSWQDVWSICSNWLRPREVRRQEAERAEAQWQAVIDDWMRRRDQWEAHREQLIRERHQLSFSRAAERRLRNRWIALSRLHARPKAEIMAELPLERFRLDAARITGIGPKALATLKAAGVETAFDLHPEVLETIHGIGPDRRRALMAWCQARRRMAASPYASRASLSKIRRRHVRALRAGLAQL